MGVRLVACCSMKLLIILAVVGCALADSKADPEAGLLYGGYGGYGYGRGIYGGYGGYGLGYSRGYLGGYGGYGLGYGRSYYGGYGHHYGKRSVDAEPEADSDADAGLLYGGYGGYGYGRGIYGGYGGYGLGYSRGYLGGYGGYGLGYGRSYYGGYGHHFGKRSADAEPEADSDAEAGLL